MDYGKTIPHCTIPLPLPSTQPSACDAHPLHISLSPHLFKSHSYRNLPLPLRRIRWNAPNPAGYVSRNLCIIKVLCLIRVAFVEAHCGGDGVVGRPYTTRPSRNGPLVPPASHLLYGCLNLLIKTDNLHCAPSPPIGHHCTTTPPPSQMVPLKPPICCTLAPIW